MSRKKRMKRLESAPRPFPTHRLDQKLRDLSLDAERALRRRQFDRSFDDEFMPKVAEKVPTRVDGTPAHIVERVSGRPLSARGRFQDSLPERELPPVHTYFQERPEIVTACTRRKERRSVLFALRRTRKGSAAGKKHEWTELSKVRCS